METKDIHPSKTIRRIIIVLIVFVVALAIFTLGMAVGTHRARFAGRFGDNFDRNFVNPRSGGSFGTGMHDWRFPGEHGAVGEIVSINLPTIVVADKENIEKTVIIKDNTLIRQFNNEATTTDLKTGDFVVVLGQPNTEGQIEAKLVRIVPTPTASSTKQ